MCRRLALTRRVCGETHGKSTNTHQCRGTGATVYIDLNMVNHMASSRTMTISEPCSFVKELVLKPCVGNDQLIASTEVQQLIPILIALSHAVRSNERVPRRNVRAYMTRRRWNRGKRGLELVIEGFRGTVQNSHVGHVAFQLES